MKVRDAYKPATELQYGTREAVRVLSQFIREAETLGDRQQRVHHIQRAASHRDCLSVLVPQCLTAASSAGASGQCAPSVDSARRTRVRDSRPSKTRGTRTRPPTGAVRAPPHTT